MGRNGQLSHFFFPSFIFLLEKTAQILRIPYNPLQLVREGQNATPNKFCSESRYVHHTSPTVTSSHKDHCTILSVDPAARWCSILRALHSTKGKNILKNNVSLPPIYYYTGEDNHLVTHCYLHRVGFLTYSSLKQLPVGRVGSTQRKQETTFSGSSVLHGLSFIIKQDPPVDPYVTDQQSPKPTDIPCQLETA